MQKKSRFIFSSRLARAILILLIFALGIAIRVYDLTDPPMDFHPARQYHSAIIARGLYTRWGGDYVDWQTQLNVAQETSEARIEPPVFEYIVGCTYKLAGADHLWIARLYAIIFWLGGGIPLFSLAKKWTGFAGGVIALSFYLFAPYGIIASRSFQPDPIMVSVSIFAIWAYFHWYEQRTRRWAILAGLGLGTAIFIKQVAVFWLLFAVLLPLLRKPVRELVKNRQLWAMGSLAILPIALYNVYGIFIRKTLIGQYSQRFFPERWFQPGFYLQWVDKIGETVGLPLFFLALIGIFLFKEEYRRRMLVGFTLGYLLYGFVFAHHIATHDYYQLPLFPLTAMGLASVGGLLFERARTVSKKRWGVLSLVMILLVGVLLSFWEARSLMKETNFREEPAFLITLSDQMGGPQTPVVGLMEDYGAALSYYGYILPAYWWPEENGQAVRSLEGQDFKILFMQRTQGKTFFIITDFDELNAQPALIDALDDYTIIVSNNRYLVYDLRPEPSK